MKDKITRDIKKKMIIINQQELVIFGTTIMSNRKVTVI